MREPNFCCQMAGEKRARLNIYDDLGPSWLGMIDAKLVSRALDQAGELKTLDVHLNTLGGSAFEGLAIHNILKNHPATINIIVDGVAASAGSIIAMAGDHIQIPANALLMIHPCWTIAAGGEDELLAAAAMCRATNAAAVATYVARTGNTPEQITDWMAAETWFTGAEAKAAGFADDTGPAIAAPEAPAKPEQAQRFRNPPSHFSALVAMSARQELSMTMPQPAPAPAPAASPAATAPSAPPSATPAPATTPVAAPATSTPDLAAVERTRITTITALCRQAQRPEMADKMIEQPTFSVEDCRASLFEALCKDRSPVGGTGGGDPAPKDPDAAYKAEYAGQREVFQRMGTTEEQYIASRQVDDRRRQLVAGSAAAKK